MLVLECYVRVRIRVSVRVRLEFMDRAYRVSFRAWVRTSGTWY